MFTEHLVCDLKLEKRKHDILVEAIGILGGIIVTIVSREICEAKKMKMKSTKDWLTTQQELIVKIWVFKLYPIKSSR